MTVRNRAEIRQLEKEFADAKEVETPLTEQPKADNKPPREAKAGFEWEWHGDHWHEMPVAQTPQETVGQSVKVSKPEKPAYTGPLTFHEELLESNPLEALRLQSEERGHWSAKWITDYYDADDEEAQAFARTVYLRMYYNTLYKTTGKIPISEEEYHRLGEEYSSHIRSLDAIPNVYRQLALMRIGWAFLPPEREPIIND